MDLVKHEQKTQGELLRKYQQIVMNLPKGGLSTSCVNGKLYYRLTGKQNNRYHEKYLGNNDRELVRKIQARHFFDSSISIMKENLKALDYMKKHYKSYNPNAVAKDFKRAYKCTPTECFRIGGFADVKGWGSMPYERSNYYPENLRHMTLKGDLVRSKSELAILDLAFTRGIEYRYEQVLHLNEITLIPDATYLSPITYNLVYHEHAGMTHEDEYMEQFNKKLMIYRNNGIVPWKNLIITYDDENGNIDLRDISRMFDIWFGK